jgi:hypothetical protein
MKTLPHAPQQMIEQGLIEAGFNTLRGDHRRTRFAGEFDTAIYQQTLDHLADAEGKSARAAVH